MGVDSTVFAGKFYVQHTSLDQSKENRTQLSVNLLSGEKMEEFVKENDGDAILPDSFSDLLLYKHAIEAIYSTDGNFRLAVPQEEGSAGPNKLARTLRPSVNAG